MGRSEGSQIASLISDRMGKPKSRQDEDDEQLEGLMDEYKQAKDNKSKARALRAFVRLASHYDKNRR
jgi:hypothetical protein